MVPGLRLALFVSAAILLPSNLFALLPRRFPAWVNGLPDRANGSHRDIGDLALTNMGLGDKAVAFKLIEREIVRSRLRKTRSPVPDG